MSIREQLQSDLVDFLEKSGKFNAPYGILPGMKNFAKGKIRTIEFGVARYFDGTIQIISPNCLTISGRGPLAYKYAGKFDSYEQICERLNS